MRVASIHPGPEGYLILFAWVFAEQIGLPLPAAPALLAAGALAAGGSLNLVLLIVVALAASVLADYLWYRAGTFRSDTMGRFLRRHPDSRVLRNAERLVARYGSCCLVFAKFVPGLSLAAPPLSGMCGTSAAQFLLFDIFGSLIWTSGLAGIGYYFGSAIDSGSVPISPRLCVWCCAGLALGFAGIWSARSLWRKLREQTSAPTIAAMVVRMYKEDSTGTALSAAPDHLRYYIRSQCCCGISVSG